MKLKEAIKFLSENKTLDPYKADKYRFGKTTFRGIIQLLIDKFINNSTNRFEDVVTKKDYRTKLHHMIRFISRISSKGSILLSVITDIPSKQGFIRDVGTMVSLIHKYFDTAHLTGLEWVELCDDIIKERKPIESKKKFMYMIKEYIQGLSPERQKLKYSLKQIVESSDECKELFLDTPIAYELNLYTSYEHALDMQLVNKPEKPWNSFDFFDTPHRTTKYEKYHEVFLGEELLKFFEDKIAAHHFPKMKLMSGWDSTVKSKVAYRLVPIYFAYCISRYVDDMDELDAACEMIARYKDAVKKDHILKYWTNMFGKMIDNTTYDQMVEFYEKEYLEVYNDTNWDIIIDTLTNLSIKFNNGKMGQALKGLDIKKDDTGLYFLSLALWFRQNYPSKGLSTIVKEIVNAYDKLLKGNVQWEYEKGKIKDVPVIEYFGERSSEYNSTSVNQRILKLFTYIPTMVKESFEGKKTNRTKQTDYKKHSLSKHSNVLGNSTGFYNIMICPLSSEELVMVNFKTGEGLVWIHPNDDKNLPVDGHLGPVEDNQGKYKDLDWTTIGVGSQKEYWEKVLEHNIDLYDKCKDKISKMQLEAACKALTIFVNTDLEVK